ncbi:MAG: MATE family efflux transporter [Aeriscardovia sp.]|nr:MATE family efflux transporter [Aeriscardovia sp.]MBQ5505251.1 MATE family efflux transporter [Aeriscardovia sp.]
MADEASTTTGNTKTDAAFVEMTTAPLGPLITRMSVPAVIANVIGVAYNLTDTFYVGKLGTAASAASGVAMPVMVAIQAFGLLFGAGAGNKIAVLLGKKNMTLAKKLVTTAFFAAFAISVVLGAAGLLLLHPLARVLGSTPTIEPLAIKYLTPLLWVAPLYCTSYVFDPVLRFQGRAKESMIGIGAGTIVNIGLEPVFIFALHLGMFGAGLATAICESLSFFLLLGLFRSRSGVPLTWSQFSLSSAVLREILAGGLPNFVRNVMGAAATDVFNLSADPFGNAAISAITIVNRVLLLTASAEIGFGRGYQPVCGYNYGSGHFDRVRRGYWLIVRASVVLLVSVAVLQSVWAPQLIQVFRDDPTVVRYGAAMLRWQSLTFPLYAYIICSNMMQQTLGHTAIASIVGLGRQGIFLVPALLILPRHLGFFGLVAAQPISDLCTFLMTLPLQRHVMKELRPGAAVATTKLERAAAMRDAQDEEDAADA